jgi:outer membrane protein assembly factor BamB
MSPRFRWPAVVGCLVAALPALAADGVELSLALPRTQYTTAEPVEIALVYKNGGGNLRKLPLEVKHADGSSLTFEVPFDAAGKEQARVVTVRGGVLKLGRYTAAARAGAVEKSVAFAVHPDQHPNAFWVGQWVHHGESRGTTLAKGGWMYMSSDLATLHPRRPKPGDPAEWYVEARMRPFARMVLGGGHQLDLELVNDWGDPWVQRTIAWRMQLAALSNRLYPVAGLHCFDEPGLTWWPIEDDKGKVIETNPFAIPHQLQEFTKLTGKKMPVGKFADVGPKYAGRMDEWLAFMDLRMKYLEQAWHATRWGTESAAPGMATINQVSSSYAPGDTTDGVDSRQNRPYQIVSGHGGYSDLPFGTMQPVRSAEAFQGFTRDRPHYFLPMWYTHTWASMRNAIWMAWTTKLDGLMYTPEQDFGMDNSGRGYDGTHTVFEVAEINRRLALVGDVLRQVPKTPAPVAVLHSHREYAHDVATYNSPALHMPGAPQYFSPHHNAVDACFFRILEQGFAPNWLDEAEATERGADFLKQWKVILCPRLSTASPTFRETLEKYVAAGGKLVQFKGDKLLLKGSIVADHDFGDPGQYYAEKVQNDGGILSPNYRDLAWRKWNNDLAPTFAKDLAAWVGPQEYECSNKEVLLAVHRAGKARYLLFANNAQSKENPRGLKHELVPAETTVTIPNVFAKQPAGGLLLDLFNGGSVPVKDGRATLRLAAGDGACWVHMPNSGRGWKVALGSMQGWMQRPGQPKEYIPLTIGLHLGWSVAGPWPFRVRLFDPAGNLVEQLIRATAGADGATAWGHDFPLGPLATPGTWKVKIDWLALGESEEKEIGVPPGEPQPLGAVAAGPCSVSVEDAGRISSLFAGKAFEPPFDKLNWDAKRVFGLDPKKFAVFGPDGQAKKVADALKAKGMAAEVNPKYEVKPFVREPGRGGAGVSYGVNSNLENIHAHAVVLPGHPLLVKSQERGHVNRVVNAAFPGPGRAFIQWGIGCYQAGCQNVFVLGDIDAGVAWLLDAINGKVREEKPGELTYAVKSVPAKTTEYPAKFTVPQAIKLDDTPVGVGAPPDGKVIYTLCYDGRVLAHDRDGKQLWHSQALLEGCALVVSPKGDRLAVAGYPGLLVLDAKDGKVLGGFRTEPAKRVESLGVNRMACVAWNDAGTRAAGGWLNPDAKTALDPVVLDAEGKVVCRPKAIAGGVMGAAFVPKTDTLLLGADQLTAVNPTDGSVLWRNPVRGAQAFAFGPDGKTAAAGGWGKSVGVFSLADGKVIQTTNFDSVIGGIAFLPGGEVAVAVWGGVHPLFAVRGGKAEPLFASSFGFQNVVWSEKHGGLIAAEQGGRLWLLDARGTPRALLGEDAGTTAYRMHLHGGEVLLARMDRVVQRVTAGGGR